MSLFISSDESDQLQKLNIDELYEKNRLRHEKQISIYNKILNRIHKRITLASRIKYNDKYIWFLVPEFIFGENAYDNGDCIAYCISKLEENGFHIRYIHPNTLFISWENWVPLYVRNEIKRKQGIIVDEKGNVIETKTEEPAQEENKKDAKKNKYNSIGNYKPTGSLVYDPELLEKMEKKVTFQT
jgi:hypothetical protein